MDVFSMAPLVDGANWRVVCTTKGCGFKCDAAGRTKEDALMTVRHDVLHDVQAVAQDYSTHPLYKGRASEFPETERKKEPVKK